MIQNINWDITFIYVPWVDSSPQSCPLCKNEDTHWEVRTWDERYKKRRFYYFFKLLIRFKRVRLYSYEKEMFVIPPKKVTVCSHCKNDRWDGYAW